MQDTQSDFKYRAFISYSHENERIARWLHRALERYRVPRQLLKHHSSQRRLTPVFLDRDEFASSGDLAQSIKDALEASEFLIIICSPASARSRWVDQEVQGFLDLGRRTKILCIIAEGDPPNIYPPALRESLQIAEPLAADMRAQGDGKSNALLKIVAALLGVGYDAVRQRDAVARQRRVTAIVGASLTGMILTSALAFYALQQQREAEQESLKSKQISAFLVDLFEGADPYLAQKQKEPTLRELLNRGAERIDTVLADQPEVRAEMQELMGIVYRRIGDNQTARTFLERAVESKQTRNNSPLDLGEALRELAVLNYVEGRYEEARDGFARALELFAGQGNSVAAARDMALTLSELNEFDEALVYAGRALDMARITTEPDTVELAIIHNALAIIHKDMGSFDQSRTHFEQAYSYRQSAVDGNRSLTSNIMASYASLLSILGEAERAVDLLEEALEINETVFGSEHPSVAAILINIGSHLIQLERYADALTRLEPAEHILTRALGADHYHVGLTLANQAECLLELGQPKQALDRALQARTIFITRIGTDHSNTLVLSILEAEIRFALGESIDAVELLERTRDMLSTTLGNEHPIVSNALYELAIMRWDLGERTVALDLLDQSIGIREATYAPAHPELTSAIEQRDKWLAIE